MTAAELHELEVLLAFLKRDHGYDFTGYKRTSLGRRVYMRVAALGLNGIEAYTKHIETHSDEIRMLLENMLINATGFFRDSEAWSALANRVFSRLLLRDNGIRIWSAGCASGEEVWTAAILLSEVLGEDRYRRQVTLYASDLDPDAVMTLRAGRYRALDVAAVPEAYRSRYFEQSGGTYLVGDHLRTSVVTSCHDLLRDPPVDRLDLVICRNTMIYFTIETQMKLLTRFHSALEEGAHLFLGTTELPLTNVRLFEPVDTHAHIFARVSEFPQRGHRGREAGQLMSHALLT